MSKSIKKARTSKTVKFTAIVGGKEISVKSSCKKFGKPVMNAVKEHVGTCKKCSDKNSDIFKVCKAVFIKNTPVAKKKTTSKITNNTDMKDGVKFILENLTMNKKAIVKKLSQNSKRTEGGWTTMVGAIFLSMKCLNGKGSGKGAFYWAGMGIRKGILDKKKLDTFVAQKEKKTEKLVSGSVNYVYRVYTIIEALKNDTSK